MLKNRLLKDTIPGFLIVLTAIFLLNSCNTAAKKKEASTITEIQNVPKPATKAKLPPYLAEGKKVYRQVCLTCHQANGGGVPGLNPPLIKTDYVLGDKNTLLEIIIKGSEAQLEGNKSEYANVMQGYGMLGDEEIANVASYIRNSFGNKAEPITASEVAAYRSANKK
ncbi:c-type cytochrome [uncultured Eudoraea sp.]|uniref:c-type cytochrome n=1 Tax=uncultured Eudoraea sp. TaxID=1035614 RepID=UPI002606C788|nr:c-type cytochrome [uncultured Eudoraea sp.]